MKLSFQSLLFAFIFIVFLLQCLVKADNWSQNEKLRKKLLEKYDIFALPQRDVNGTTTVKIGCVVKRISLDDDTQVFTLTGWMRMNWIDSRLKWDNKDYGGLKIAHFGDKELWKPDLLVYNNAEGSEIDHYGNVHLLVYSTGMILWVPPAIMKVPCPVNLKYWPFDTQKCKIILGSWTTHGWQLDLELRKNTSEILVYEMLKDSDKWKIVESKQYRHAVYFAGYDEPYVSLSFTFTIKRNSPNFAAFVVIPAVVIPILLMIQFILPVDHSKRLTIGLVCSILVVMELLFLKYSIPKIGSVTPLVVTYYSQCLVVVVLTIFLSAILGRLSHPTHPLLDFPPPEFVKIILTGPLAVILCVSLNASKVGMSGKSTEDGEVLTDSSKPNFSHEWLLIAKVVDRLSLILIACVFIFSMIGYIAPIK